MDKKSLINLLKEERRLQSPAIIKAFELVPREEFVPPQYKKFAYVDEPLPIGYSQTISAPSIVALMTELLKPKKSDKVLEIGSGSGYQAAILSRLVKKVYTVEYFPELAAIARRNLAKCGYKNVEIMNGDGNKGYEKEKPYHKIIMTCACEQIPKPLIRQLKVNGRLVAPVGSSWYQELTLLIKTESGIKTETHGACVFVPLRKA